MELNCQEMKEMANLILGDRIKDLEERLAASEKRNREKDQHISHLQGVVLEQNVLIHHLDEVNRRLRSRTMGRLMLALLDGHSLVLDTDRMVGYVKKTGSMERAVLGRFCMESVPENTPQEVLDFIATATKPELPQQMHVEGDYVDVHDNAHVLINNKDND